MLGGAGCASRPSPIPSGAYYSRATRERVTVTPTHLALDLRIRREGRTDHITKVVNYTVLPDSRIWTSGYGSAEYASTFWHFDWRWDGSQIILSSRFPPRTKAAYFHLEP